MVHEICLAPIGVKNLLAWATGDHRRLIKYFHFTMTYTFLNSFYLEDDNVRLIEQRSTRRAKKINISISLSRVIVILIVFVMGIFR